MSEKKDQKLNLPKTEIPMKANLNEREPKMLEEWSKRDVYQKIRKNKQTAESKKVNKLERKVKVLAF